MPEESVDEFLNKATAERKPLSDQEKEEAMVVAGKVWRAAIEKTKGQASIGLKLEDENSRTYIYIYNPQHEDSKYNKKLLQEPNTDLIVNVFKNTLNREGLMMHTLIDTYDFSPGKVVKVETHVPQSDPNKNLSIEDSLQLELAMRNNAKRKKEQSTEERYQPDKQDLQSLLDIVSSAQELQPSSAKIVPWPK